MDSSNIYRFNGVDPFDDWVISNGHLYGYYPRNSLIHALSKRYGITCDDGVIYIPKLVTNIDGSCFRNNTSIKKVYVSSSVMSISNTAFTNTDIILVVYPDTYAERYAKKKGMKYEYMKIK